MADRLVTCMNDDVTWPRKVEVVTPICLGPIIINDWDTRWVMTSCDPKGRDLQMYSGIEYLLSVTDGIGQTPCSFEHYLVLCRFGMQFLQITDLLPVYNGIIYYYRGNIALLFGLSRRLITARHATPNVTKRWNRERHWKSTCFVWSDDGTYVTATLTCY